MSSHTAVVGLLQSLTARQVLFGIANHERVKAMDLSEQVRP
jgi:hypothetical protein